MNSTPPARKRLQTVDEEAIRVASELQSIDSGESAEFTKTVDGEVFDHREWLEEELQQLRDEQDTILNLTDSTGDVPYPEA